MRISFGPVGPFRAAAAAMTVMAATAVTAIFTGCGSDEGESACKDYAPPAGVDLQTPPSQFSRDVMPIFARSCAFTSCHGDPSGRPNGVYLGGGDAKKVRQGLVGVRTMALPSMEFVKPGDPRESFLMRKLDGSHCMFASQCTVDGCGQQMPHNEPPLSLETRDTIRRWIAQGAKDD